MRYFEHPDFFSFVDRYACNIERFALEVCNTILTQQQIDMVQSVQVPGSRTSVSSGHGTGKTRAIAVVVLWHLLCYIRSNTLLTAPKVEQIRNLVWKEITTVVDEAIEAGQFNWIFGDKGYLVVETKRVYIRGSKDNWYAIAKTAPRGSPENLAGAHGKYYLLIADEASGIPDDNYSVLLGALTGDDNRALLTSQPTRPSGFFYRTHHELAKRNGGAWNTLTMSSLDSSLVGTKFILDKLKEYSTEQFLVKVLGEFPQNIGGMLTSREAIDKCFKRGRIIQDNEAYGLMLPTDIGGGEGRDYSTSLLARIIGTGNAAENARRVEIIEIPLYSNTTNIHNYLAQVYQYAKRQDATMVTPIDVMGLGHGAPSILEAQGMSNIHKVRWGQPCFQLDNAEIYHNLVAQAHVSLQRAVLEGRLSFLTTKHKERILDEGSRIPYTFDSQFRYQILGKNERTAKGIPSPDIWDAIAFLFLEGIQYNVHSNYGTDLDNLDVDSKKSLYISAFDGFN